MSQASIELDRVRAQVGSAVENAQERYHTDIRTYEAIPGEDFDIDRTHRQVTRLREKLDALGAINMMAIDEYQELMQRHGFISAQKNEIERSIALLEDALEEIEETSKNKFLDTFKVVDAEFQSLFPILFPGGEARLEMTAPEDPLTPVSSSLRGCPERNISG